MSSIILGYISGNRSWTIPSTQHWEGLRGNTWSSFGRCTSEKIWRVWRKAGQEQYNSAEDWKNGNCGSLHGGCLTVEETWNNLQVNKGSTEKKEITCSSSLRTKRHKYSRTDADQALLGKLSWWAEEWHTGRSFLGKRSPPSKTFRYASSFTVNCRYRQLWAASPKGLASWMHNSGLSTTEVKPIFKTKKANI